MRVLLAITHTGGGVGKHVADLTSFLKKKGISFYVATGVEKKDFFRIIQNNSKKILIIKHLKRKISLCHDLMALIEIFFLLRKRKFDLIHVHGPKAGFLFRLVGKLLNIPVIYTHHLIVYKQFNTKLNIFYKFFEKLASAWGDYVIVVTESARKTLIDDRILKPNKIDVIYNGLFNTRLKYTKKYARKILKISEKYFVICFIGKLEEPKDPETLIKSFSLFSKNVNNSVLFILGEGSLKNKLKKLICFFGLEKTCLLLGFKEDVELYLAASDVFVLTTKKEGLPISILEAMKYFLPVISNRVDGVPEEVEDGKNGFLIDIGDYYELFKKILILYRDKELRKKMGANSRKMLEQKFLLEKNYIKLIEIYKKTIVRKCRKLD
ncbi:MAG: glycosyltransferase [Promethearchaeota archaeon]